MAEPVMVIIRFAGGVDEVLPRWEHAVKLWQEQFGSEYRLPATVVAEGENGELVVVNVTFSLMHRPSVRCNHVKRQKRGYTCAKPSRRPDEPRVVSGPSGAGPQRPERASPERVALAARDDDSQAAGGPRPGERRSSGAGVSQRSQSSSGTRCSCIRRGLRSRPGARAPDPITRVGACGHVRKPSKCKATL